MKLEELVREVEEYEAEQRKVEAERRAEGQDAIARWLGQIGICIEDGWTLIPEDAEVALLVGHRNLPFVAKVWPTRIGYDYGHVATQVGAEDEPRSLHEARDLLKLMEEPINKKEPQQAGPADALLVRALEVAEHLGKARQRYATAALAVAVVERGTRIAQALAEERAISAAGGEKELGANAEAQEEMSIAEAEMLGAADELKVLVAAMGHLSTDCLRRNG